MKHRTLDQFRWVVLGAFLAAIPTAAAAQTGANVLVVTNAASAASNQIGDYYVRKRQVPGDQVLRLAMPAKEEIPRAAYEQQIERPIAEWLTAQSAQDRILYIVLTKDVPIRITGTTGLQGTVASVDSELTLLYRKLCQVTVPLAGSIKNPYFLGDASISTAKPSTHRLHDLYLVTRLDGFTVADVLGLIDRGAAPGRDGRILLDERAEITESAGNKSLQRAATELRKIEGWREHVVLDAGPGVLHDESNVFGYYSWGSNDSLNFLRHLKLGFVPGAIGATFVSTDARTFQEPPPNWAIRVGDFAGSSQSLIGDLIHDGITGAAGHVAEPYLNATIRPDVLFPAYVSGMNLAEAFYLAMPFVSWQTVVVGDPLCAPFRQAPIPATEIDAGIDTVTGLPRIFADRRVALLASAGVVAEAARQFIRGDALLRKKDQAGARLAFEEAAKLDPKFVLANFTLATLYEAAGDSDSAIARYRLVVAQTPNHAAALNNLAYLLATKKNAAAEALPLAVRAYEIAKEATIADTLGWVQHLLGKDAEAEPLVVEAARRVPANPEVHLHAAFILAANGKTTEARAELSAAVKLDPKLEERADIRELRQRLLPKP
jgi:uncharacterized protein (TIGR03790 family)